MYISHSNIPNVDMSKILTKCMSIYLKCQKHEILCFN